MVDLARDVWQPPTDFRYINQILVGWWLRHGFYQMQARAICFGPRIRQTAQDHNILLATIDPVHEVCACAVCRTRRVVYTGALPPSSLSTRISEKSQKKRWTFSLSLFDFFLSFLLSLPQNRWRQITTMDDGKLTLMLSLLQFDIKCI